MTPEERRQKIKELEKQIDNLRGDLYTLREECIHQISHPTKKDMRTGDFGGAYCLICGYDFGWWCPASPDSVCHYHSDENGKVELITGESVDFPKDEYYDPEYESSDCCLFCGDPDERK